MFDGQEIEEIVRRKFGLGNIYLVTLSMPNLEAWSGKAAWVNKHLSFYNTRLIITTASKLLLAGPNTLLIDDRDKNVEEFRKAGGQAILVPRPWNKNHDMPTLPHLREKLQLCPES